MKTYRIMFICLALVNANACATKDELSEVNARLDAIENVTIASIDQQILAIKTSIGDLEATDKELKGYIQNLQTSATELQKAINSTNDKIDKVEGTLRSEIQKGNEDLSRQIEALSGNLDQTSQKLSGDILTAKTDVLAQLEAFRTEMNGELNTVNAALESLREKDIALGKRIDDLKAYTDGEIKSAKDWATASFSTLEQYNKTVDEITGIKSDITGLNNSLTALEARLNEKIAKDIAAATAGLQEELRQQAEEITNAYKSAIAKAKGELESAYNQAIARAIESSESTLQAWVNGRLTGYYTISETDAKLSTLKSQLENQLETQKTYFETMITSLSSQLDERIRANSGAIEKLQEDVTSLGGQVATQAQTILNHATSIQNNAKQIEQNAADIVANGNDHDAIRTLIQANQEAIEENASAIAANKKAIEEANLSISAEDVAKNTAAIARNLQMISQNAEDIASHAELIAKNASGIADNSSAISANATDIASLRSDLNTAKNTLTEEYLQAIQTAISTLDGKLSGEISQKVSKINSDITSLQTSTNSRLSALESRANTLEANVISIQASIASIREDIAGISTTLDALVSRIQTITFLPRYADGKVKIDPHETAEGRFTFTIDADFEINPHTAVEELVAHPALLSAKATLTTTKSESSFIEMPLLGATSMGDGVIRLTLDYQEVHQKMSIGQFPVFSITISNQLDAIQSAYIPINLGIRFESSVVRNALIAANDKDKDGEFSFKEAESLTSLNRTTLWGKDTDMSKIDKFNEFKYFTNVTILEDHDFDHNLSAAFYGCRNLTTIQLPKSIIRIGKRTFYGSYGANPNTTLKKIEIPESIQTIGEYAFQGRSFEKIVLPSVISIESEAFCDCTSCTFYIKSPACTLLNHAAAFTGSPSGNGIFGKNPTIFVPKNNLSFYRTATYWKEVSSQIFGFDYDNEAIPD